MANNTEIELNEKLNLIINSDELHKGEMEIIKRAQNNLKEHQSDTKVAQRLKQELSLLATQQRLSASLVDLLTWLSQSYMGWGKRGMGLTTIFQP